MTRITCKLKLKLNYVDGLRKVIEREDGAESYEGLIRARGALAKIDLMIDEMIGDIYEARGKETDRKVRL